jgi:hypothetical protein
LLGRMGNIVVGVGIVGFDKAGHAGVRDGSQDKDAGFFWSGRTSLMRLPCLVVDIWLHFSL